jgi:hypothetical protein
LSCFDFSRPIFILPIGKFLNIELIVRYPQYPDDMSDSFDDDDYNYDVVGESFQRDHLTSLIRAHDAFNTGVIYSNAVLEMEPTNAFDPFAVKVVVEGTQVGYIPKFDSPAVTKMIQESGKKVYEVPARIGFDTDSPSPPIGVKIILTVE